MNTPPKHLLIESLLLWVLAFYLAMAVTVLVGLATWMLGGQETVLKASWIRWCATIAIVPVGLRLVFRLGTRVICDGYRTCIADWLKHGRVKLSYQEQHPYTQKEQRQYTQKEQRQNPRYCVELPARVASDHRPCGFGMIADLSVTGCRVKGKTTVAPGDFGKLLITVPTAMTPLTVSLTWVRWVNEHEYGLEFILMEPTEEGCLNRCLNRAQSQPKPALAVVS